MMENEITSLDLDILTEIGNIGAGNAATALSTMLDKVVLIDIPLAKFYDLAKIPNILGGAENVRTGIFLGINGALNGYIFFILKDKDADKLSKIAAGEYNIDTKSILLEITNIISGAYVSAIGSIINDSIYLTPPEFVHDMIGALIDSFVPILCNVADKAMIIGTKLTIGDKTISGFYILMLEQGSLQKLLDYLKSN